MSEMTAGREGDDEFPVARRAAKRQPGALAKGTLGRRLVWRVVALISATALALSALSLVAIFVSFLDRRNSDVTDDARAEFEQGGVSNTARSRQENRATRERGTVSVIERENGRIETYVIAAEGPIPLPADVEKVLREVKKDEKMHMVTLPNLGPYYVFAGTRKPKLPNTVEDPAKINDPTYIPPNSVVTGRSLAGINVQVGQMATALLGLALLAILGSVFAVRSVVIGSLRPLNRLAATADEVAETQLERGDAGLTVRVDEDNANPNNEVGRVGAALNRMLEHVDNALAARQASEMKVRRFVADASHELRNPLAAIRGYAEITRRQRDELPPDSAFALSRIEAESARMNSLVEDMLLLARLDDNPQLELESVELNEALAAAVSDIQVAGPDHEWALDLPPQEVEAIVDRNRFHQVIVNLLTNARVHTPPGTHVLTTLIPQGDRARIIIADDGPGIPEDLQPKVFERFVRADAARARTGSQSTGLGLAIVAGVVEAHGGTVQVQSKPGDTRFIIDIPLDGPFSEDDFADQ